jgi:hypothetical protein
MGGTQICGVGSIEWFSSHLEEPPRDVPYGLIDPRGLSAAHHFLQVSRRILHPSLCRVRSADPTLALIGYPRLPDGTKGLTLVRDHRLPND